MQQLLHNQCHALTLQNIQGRQVKILLQFTINQGCDFSIRLACIYIYIYAIYCRHYSGLLELLHFTFVTTLLNFGVTIVISLKVCNFRCLQKDVGTKSCDNDIHLQGLGLLILIFFFFKFCVKNILWASIFLASIPICVGIL